MNRTYTVQMVLTVIQMGIAWLIAGWLGLFLYATGFLWCGITLFWEKVGTPKGINHMVLSWDDKTEERLRGLGRLSETTDRAELFRKSVATYSAIMRARASDGVVIVRWLSGKEEEMPLL